MHLRNCPIGSISKPTAKLPTMDPSKDDVSVHDYRSLWGHTCFMLNSHICMQVMGVLDAMPASNLKPEAEDGILEENRVYRTTYMFSATMPPPVERLARKYMRRPAVINIGSAGKATDNVTQKVLYHHNDSCVHRC